MEPVLAAIILSASVSTEDMSLVETEKIYWDCEFAATRGVLDPTDAATCSEASEYLKKHKFPGDFDRFLVWWKANKDREFSRRMQRR